MQYIFDRVSSLWTFMTLLVMAAGAGAAETTPLHADAKLAEIIQKVRDNEKLFQNLDVTIVSNGQLADPKFQKHWNESSTEQRSRTVWQNELLYFDGEETRASADGKSITERQKSAYDGERTHSFQRGNSANVHLERHESSAVFPPHTWTLKNLRINFPLSVYLQGTDAVRKHPKVHNYANEGGSVFEFTKVETSLDGEEEVGGLACIKVRCRRWYYSNDKPQVHTLWLCPERNFHCVKMQTLSRAKKPKVDDEASIDEWNEVSPGVWLPSRITYRTQDRQWIESLLVEEAKFDPRHPAQFFRDVQFPDDLPLYTIKNGRLVDSDIYQREPPADSDQRVKAVIDAIRTQEAHYLTMEIEVRKTYRHFDLDMLSGGGFRPHQASFSRERTILQPTRGICLEEQTTDFAGNGGRSVSTQRTVYNDGWLRRTDSYIREDEESKNHTLQRGGFDQLPVHRPHMLLFRDNFQNRALSDYLGSGWEDRRNKYRLSVSYLGTDTRDNLQCDVLRLDVLAGTKLPKNQQSFRVVWLARDRNYLPIRYEWHEPLRGGEFPTGIGYARQLKELRPGVWFPMLVTMVAHERCAMADLSVDEVLLQHRTEYQIESVKLESDTPAAAFAVADVAKGVKAGLLDESGRHLGQFVQAEEGPLAISDEKYSELLKTADDREKKR